MWTAEEDCDLSKLFLHKRPIRDWWDDSCPDTGEKSEERELDALEIYSRILAKVPVWIQSLRASHMHYYITGVNR